MTKPTHTSEQNILVLLGFAKRSEFSIPLFDAFRALTPVRSATAMPGVHRLQTATMRPSAQAGAGNVIHLEAFRAKVALHSAPAESQSNQRPLASKAITQGETQEGEPSKVSFQSSALNAALMDAMAQGADKPMSTAEFAAQATPKTVNRPQLDGMPFSPSIMPGA